jgi:hypothetical protein
VWFWVRRDTRVWLILDTRTLVPGLPCACVDVRGAPGVARRRSGRGSYAGTYGPQVANVRTPQTCSSRPPAAYLDPVRSRQSWRPHGSHPRLRSVGPGDGQGIGPLVWGRRCARLAEEWVEGVGSDADLTDEGP